MAHNENQTLNGDASNAFIAASRGITKGTTQPLPPAAILQRLSPGESLIRSHSSEKNICPLTPPAKVETKKQ